MTKRDGEVSYAVALYQYGRPTGNFISDHRPNLECPQWSTDRKRRYEWVDPMTPRAQLAEWAKEWPGLKDGDARVVRVTARVTEECEEIAPPPPRSTKPPEHREQLGQKARLAWSGREKELELPWAAISENSKETYRRVGEALFDEGARHATEHSRIAKALRDALLRVEWSGSNNPRGDCPCCRHSREGGGHNPTRCAVDEALTAAGLSDTKSRDDQRERNLRGEGKGACSICGDPYGPPTPR